MLICRSESILSAVAVVVSLVLLGASPGWAQQKDGDQRKQLVGSWKVLSYKAQSEGQQEWREPLGPNPKGYVVFTAGGRVMQMITAAGRKAPSNDAERAALLSSMNVWSGKYTVAKDQITVVVDTSWAEAHQGERQKQVRFFRIDGNRLTWRTPPQIGGRALTAGTSQGKSVTEIVMEREK